MCIGTATEYSPAQALVVSVEAWSALLSPDSASALQSETGRRRICRQLTDLFKKYPRQGVALLRALNALELYSRLLSGCSMNNGTGYITLNRTFKSKKVDPTTSYREEQANLNHAFLAILPRIPEASDVHESLKVARITIIRLPQYSASNNEHLIRICSEPERIRITKIQ